MNKTIPTLLANEYIQSALYLAISVVAAQVMAFVLKVYVRRLTQKTKSDFDDRLLNIATGPLWFLVITIGVRQSLGNLPVLADYIDGINKVIYALIILAVTVIIARIFSMGIHRWFEVNKSFEKTPRLITRFVTIITFLIAALVILKNIGVEISPILATLGVGGLAVGLALQDTLSNFFSGLHIILDKPVNVGDFIELQDASVAGYIEDIGWRSTSIRTLPNTLVVIPNSKLAGSIITNNSLPQPEMAALVQCGVSYLSDLEMVERVTIEVARHIQQTIEGAVPDFEPFIRYNQFGDSNINFTVILRVKTFTDRYLVIHHFIKALKARYDREGIEISWPVRKVYNVGPIG